EQAARHLDHRVQRSAAPIVAERRLIGVGLHGHWRAVEQIPEAVEVMDRDLGDERLLDLLHPSTLSGAGLVTSVDAERGADLADRPVVEQPADGALGLEEAV